MLGGFIGAKDGGSTGDNWSYMTCKAPVQCHQQQTNALLFTCLMPFLSANQQCQSTEGKGYLETSNVVYLAV